MYKIIITESAKLDIATAVHYIAKDLQNPVAANKLLNDFEIAATSLENMPQRHGQIKNEFLANIGFRYFMVNNFIVFYIVRDSNNTVTIERFLHSRRDWLNIIEH